MAHAYRSIASIGLLAAGPFVVLFFLLTVEHTSRWHSQPVEACFIMAALATGLAGVWMLQIKRVYRALLTAPYVVVMLPAIFVSGLPFVCAYFGDCP
jgi:hypothetical protein